MNDLRNTSALASLASGGSSVPSGGGMGRNSALYDIINPAKAGKDGGGAQPQLNPFVMAALQNGNGMSGGMRSLAADYLARTAAQGGGSGVGQGGPGTAVGGPAAPGYGGPAAGQYGGFGDGTNAAIGEIGMAAQGFNDLGPMGQMGLGALGPAGMGLGLGIGGIGLAADAAGIGTPGGNQGMNGYDGDPFGGGLY